MHFGEFLVDRDVIDRFQLLRALQLQDRRPGLHVGEAAAALGYVPSELVERMFASYWIEQTGVHDLRQIPRNCPFA